MVKPFDLAHARVVELAKSMQLMQLENNLNDVEVNNDGDDCTSEMKIVAECRELQVNEVMGIEAIYDGTDQLSISNSSDLDTLQQHIEEWQMNCESEDTDETIRLLRNIVQHPPTSFTVHITIDGVLCDNNIDDGNCNNSESIELAASLLLKVTLPALYPLDETTVPTFSVECFVATDRTAICNPDKPLESLANLEENRLYDALREEAKQLLPDPCVYEVVDSWLMEHLFEFMNISIHARHALQTK